MGEARGEPGVDGEEKRRQVRGSDSLTNQELKLASNDQLQVVAPAMLLESFTAVLQTLPGFNI